MTMTIFSFSTLETINIFENNPVASMASETNNVSIPDKCTSTNFEPKIIEISRNSIQTSKNFYQFNNYARNNEMKSSKNNLNAGKKFKNEIIIENMQTKRIETHQNSDKPLINPFESTIMTYYNIICSTSDVQNSGTNSKVTLRLKGDNGTSERIVLNKKTLEAKQNMMFIPGLTKECNIQCKDVGNIKSIILENHGTRLEDSLLLSSVLVVHPSTRHRWIFRVERWLSLFKDDGLTVGEFHGVRTTITQYDISVLTGVVKGAGTDSRVYLVLCGKWGTSPRFQLTSNETKDAFGQGMESRFFIRTHQVGQLSQLQISQDGSGLKPQWFLQRILVTEESQPQRTYAFNCNDWISNEDGNRTLPLSKTIADPNGGSTYNVIFHTANNPGAGTTSDVFVQLQGKLGNGRKHWIDSLNTAGSSSDFKHRFSENSIVKCNLKQCQPLGELIRIKLGVNGHGSDPDWLLKKVIVEDIDAKQIYEFPCKQWLTVNTSAMLTPRTSCVLPNKKEMPGSAKVSTNRPLSPTYPVKRKQELVKTISRSPSPTANSPPMHRFEVEVFTRDGRGRGIPTNIYIRLFGGDPSGYQDDVTYSKQVNLLNKANCSPFIVLSGSLIELGASSLFAFDVSGRKNVGLPTRLAVGHDNAASNADWLIEKVILKNLSTSVAQTFWCKKWFPYANKDLRRKQILTSCSSVSSFRNTAITNSNWQAEVCTSNIAGAGTSARVSMVLFSKDGTRQTPVVNLDETKSIEGKVMFEKGSCQTFNLHLGEIEKPYKLRVWHDKSGRLPDWHLEQITLQKLSTGKTYFFPCNRWLSNSREDGSIIRELPAFGPEISHPPAVLHYKVKVYTGIKSAPTMRGNIFIRIFGDAGDTGNRMLQRKPDSFKCGQVDDFVIEAVHLGKLLKVRVGTYETQATPAWFLDKLVVEELENPEKNFYFNCDKLFDANQGDGLIVRDLKVSLNLMDTTYALTTTTGELMNAGTNAKVFVCITGELGNTGSLRLQKSYSPCNVFSIGQSSTFFIEAPDVGKIKNLRIWHDNSGVAPSWYLKEVKIDTLDTGFSYIFKVEQWLSKSRPGSSIELNVPPAKVQHLEKASPYEISFDTGMHSEIDTDVYIQIYGKDKKTEVLHIMPKSKALEHGEVKKFKVFADEIGIITKIRVGHNGRNNSKGMFLEKVEIRKLVTHVCSICETEICSNLKKSQENSILSRRLCSHPSCICHEMSKTKSSRLNLEKFPTDNYIFQVGQWLSTNKEDGQLFRDLIPTAKTGEKLPIVTSMSYSIQIITGGKSSAGTSARAFITLIGSRSDSGEFVLRQPCLRGFSKNSEEKFTVNAVNLGSLNKIRLRHDNSGINPSWFVEAVRISENLTPHRTFFFPCNQWLAVNEGDGQIVRELIVGTDSLAESSESSWTIQESSQSSLIVGEETYNVRILTGKRPCSGTTADVFIVLHGETQNSGRIHLKQSSNADGVVTSKFETGNIDVFSIKLINLGPIKLIQIGHDNKGNSPAWFVERVEVQPLSLGSITIFPCNQWIGMDVGNRKLVVDLLPEMNGISKTSSMGQYEFKVLTSTMSNSSTTANVFAQLIGPSGKSSSRVNLKGEFRQGSTDLLLANIKHVGAPIMALRIGHDNTGASPSWHLDRVEVRNVDSELEAGKSYVFNCCRWLAADKEDGLVERLLPLSVGLLSDEDSNSQMSELTLPADTFNYEVSVFTAKSDLVGATANFCIMLIDEEGNREERKLIKPTSIQSPFSCDQSESFILEDVSLKNIQKIIIRRDDAGPNSTLYLDHVEIRQISKSFKSKPLVFNFKCWVSNRDQSTRIEAIASETVALTMPALPQISQQDYPKNGTEQKKQSYKLPLSPATTVGSFGDAAADETSITDINDMNYIVTIRTSDKIGAGTKGPIVINIIDKDGKATGWLCLQTRQGNSTLSAGSIEKFVFKAPSIQSISTIDIHNQATGNSQLGWHLQSITIEIPESGQIYEIPGNVWVTDKKGTGRAYHQISVIPMEPLKSTIRPSGKSYRIRVKTGNIASADTKANVFLRLKGENGSSDDLRLSQSDDKDVLFKQNQIDQFVFKNIRYIGNLQSCRLWHDNTGPSPNWLCEWVRVSELVENRSHSIADTDEWVFLCNEWLSSTAGNKNCSIELVASKDEPKYRKPEGISIVEDIIAIADAEVNTFHSNTKHPEDITYIIDVETSNSEQAGTDNTGWIILKGKEGQSRPYQLKHPQNRPVLQNGTSDTFSLICQPLGYIKEIYVGLLDSEVGFNVEAPEYVNSIQARKMQWSCRRILVTDTQDGKTYVFNINQWISLTDSMTKSNGISAKPAELHLGARKIQRDDIKSNKPDSKMVVYKVTIFTSNASGSGTTANVYLTIYGTEKMDTGSSRLLLVRPDKIAFVAGAKDEFSVTCKNLGDVKRIRLEQDNTGDAPDWFVEKVIVEEVESGRIWAFPYFDWISLSKGSKSLAQDIYCAE